MSKREMRNMKVNTFGSTQRGEKDRREESEESFMEKVHLNKGEPVGGF